MIRVGVVVALIASVVFVFAGVREHEFLAYDDDLYVVDNPNLRQPLDLRAVARAFTSPYETNWIPLTWLSLHLDYAWHGLDAGAFLATNLALHAAASALLFLGLLRLSGALWPSAFAAGVFAVHPLHVESVAWVAERKDALTGVFFGLALWAYAGSARAGREGNMLGTQSMRAGPFTAWGAEGSGLGTQSVRAGPFTAWGPRHLAASAALAAGLCAKQSLVPLPLVFLLLDFWPLRRLGAGATRRISLGAALREKWLLFALAAGGAAAALWAQRTGGAMAHGDALPLDVRLANAALAVVAYLRDAVWPAGLAAFYPHPEDAVSRVGAALAAAALAGVTALCIRLRASQPWLAVGWLWFLLLLAPTLGLLQIGVQARADRYTYLALTGLAVALAWSAEAWAAAWPWRRRACAAAALALLCALAFAARRQVSVWRDTELLFLHATAVTQGNFLAEHALGSERLHRGDAATAERHFAEAVRLRPVWPEAHFGLADALVAQGRFEEAVRGYERGLRLGPRKARGHLRLARALLVSGRSHEALGRARYALRLARPTERAAAQTVLAAVLLAQRDFAAAEASYAQALAQRPDLVEARVGRGIALLAQGRTDEAYAELARAREGGGDSAALRLAQGDAARLLGREAEARSHYSAARERGRAEGDARLEADAAQRLAR